MWYIYGMNIEGKKRVKEQAARDQVAVLEESLGEGEEKGGITSPPPLPGQNYMELGVTYFCRGEENELERCVNFSPGLTGNCTFRDGKFCRWEERGEKWDDLKQI